jgi:cytosine/adenosine deaminase-related metal-dependent hydrolase
LLSWLLPELSFIKFKYQQSGANQHRPQFPPGRKFTIFKLFILDIKYQPQQLFTGTSLLSGGEVLICAGDGTIKDIINEADAGEGIQALEGILCPGLVNAHCHLELSHLVGKIPKKQGLVNFVGEVIKHRSGYELEEMQAAMQQEADSMYQQGIVAVGDICNTAYSIPIKKNSPIHWHNFIEIAGFVDGAAEKRFQEGRLLRDAFFNNNLIAGISPHAPYSVSGTLFQLINIDAEKKLISIHNQEAAAENELYLRRSGDFLRLYQELGIDIGAFKATGKTSLQSWLPLFNKKQSIISVHNSFTDSEDLAFAAGRDIYYCFCVLANLYIENTVPSLGQFLSQPSKLLIGTDSLASNDQLDMMTEINTIRQHFPAIPLETILQWATLNGAEALGISERFGSFDKGKSPGLVLIKEGKSVRLSPQSN